MSRCRRIIAKIRRLIEIRRIVRRSIVKLRTLRRWRCRTQTEIRVRCHVEILTQHRQVVRIAAVECRVDVRQPATVHIAMIVDVIECDVTRATVGERMSCVMHWRIHRQVEIERRLPGKDGRLTLRLREHRAVVLMRHTLLQLQVVMMRLLLHAIEHGRLLLLPDEDVVDHGAATKENADADQYAGDNCRR